MRFAFLAVAFILAIVCVGAFVFSHLADSLLRAFVAVILLLIHLLRLRTLL
jgi:hypothetical protein